jgi:hypothetical protein
MLQENADWKAEVTQKSPEDVRLFITKKCASPSDGGEGRKVSAALISKTMITNLWQYATAVSIRAALSYFYKSLRPNESTTEWRVDYATNIWYSFFFFGIVCCLLTSCLPLAMACPPILHLFLSS